MRVLVVGATGAVGRQLIPQLIAAGYQVSATTRSPAKVSGLRAAGAEPFVVDALDGAAVGETVAKAEPEVIIYEATAIPASINLRKFDQTFGPTNELRTAGLDHLLAAASAQGVRRLIAQSYSGWPNIRTGGLVKTEDDPLDPEPPAAQRAGIDAIRHLERAVTTAPMDGLALRYGSLYGPGSSEVFVNDAEAAAGPDHRRRRRSLVVAARNRCGRGDGRCRAERCAGRLQRLRRRAGHRGRVAAGGRQGGGREAADAPSGVARTACRRGGRAVDDDADPWQLQRQGQGGARLAADLADLAGGLQRRGCSRPTPTAGQRPDRAGRKAGRWHRARRGRPRRRTRTCGR